MSKVARSFADLKPLARELASARLAAELERERRAAAARLAEQERRAFELSVGPVTPLRRVDRVLHERQQPAPEPRQREADERATEADGAFAGLGQSCRHSEIPVPPQSVMKP